MCGLLQWFFSSPILLIPDFVETAVNNAEAPLSLFLLPQHPQDGGGQGNWIWGKHREGNWEKIVLKTCEEHG